MKPVFILSGISGSGKTTFVKKIIQWAEKNYKIWQTCSADFLFTDAGGNYNFDATQLGRAHAQCMNSYKEALAKGTEVIIVDNTNTTVREIRGYHRLAIEFGYVPIVLTMDCDPETAISRNVHNVPPEVIRAQAERLSKRELPEDWLHGTDLLLDGNKIVFGS